MPRFAVALVGTVLLSLAATPGHAPGAVAARSSASAAPAQRRDTVLVTLTEWTLQLSTARVPAGRTIFRIVNRGNEPHAIELEMGDREEPGDELAPGEESILTVELDPGNWDIFCPLASPSAHGGHGRRGMKRVLVVR
ncbi:MAG TPA: cupredoxin domain-containing protein [Gemmatimonadaceae bacterium]|nr:cupredoxin domain-containing protein [Gemmatimonadaceae bacterium]